MQSCMNYIEHCSHPLLCACTSHITILCSHVPSLLSILHHDSTVSIRKTSDPLCHLCPLAPNGQQCINWSDVINKKVDIAMLPQDLVETCTCTSVSIEQKFHSLEYIVYACESCMVTLHTCAYFTFKISV